MGRASVLSANLSLSYGFLRRAGLYGLPAFYSTFQLDDGKYFCCDPTYIGADVGESMPDYAGKSAKIIRL